MSWDSCRSLRARLGSEAAHGISGDAVSVSVEGCGLRIEEYESGEIGCQVRVVIERPIERSAKVIGAEDVEAGVTDKGSWRRSWRRVPGRRCAGAAAQLCGSAAAERWWRSGSGRSGVRARLRRAGEPDPSCR